MTSELRDKYFDQTIAEYFEELRKELSVDAVGLWQIVGIGGELFGLSGEQLADFVRQVSWRCSQKGSPNRSSPPLRPAAARKTGIVMPFDLRRAPAERA